MFQGYAELTKLEPETYLDWQSFETAWDNLAENVGNGLAEKQYTKGLDIDSQAKYIAIACNGVWSMTYKGKDGTSFSYEGIGYHACTKNLLHGFLDSGAPIVVYRYNRKGGTVIKGDLKEGEY
jgi:hypothetical protein